MEKDPRGNDLNGGLRENEGLRERKRRETMQRIADTGLRLFIKNGYETTTLDEIANEVGISRRTFFYYFKSKDDILLSMQSDLGNSIVAAIQNEPLNDSPLETVRNALIKMSAKYPREEMIIIDRIMRSSESVQSRKQASYIDHEKTLFSGLKERWPEPDREINLRLVAMLCIGAMRISLDMLNREDGKRPLAELFQEIFDELKTVIN